VLFCQKNSTLFFSVFKAVDEAIASVLNLELLLDNIDGNRVVAEYYIEVFTLKLFKLFGLGVIYISNPMYSSRKIMIELA
jgi:hypothetical protein